MGRRIMIFGLWTIISFNMICQGPIAEGSGKLLGNVYSYAQITNFTSYWNHVAPENAGKWGSVEGSRDIMNWGELDAAYNLAKNNGFPFRLHVLVWGNQQPNWIESLSNAEQLEEINEWFQAVADRYDSIDFIEVVNEALNDAPIGTGNGNYAKALGGPGTTGYDWVINAFKLARQYFPHSKLMINDYGIISGGSALNSYKQIIELLQADTLIDAIGIQCHAFSTRGTAANMKNSLDILAQTGLPIYATEMDIDGPSDAVQLQDYQRIFPVLWEHPAVQGITLWGWRPGLWRNEQKAYIINSNGAERPAMKWLKAYVNNKIVLVGSIDIVTSNDIKEINSTNGTLQMGKVVYPDTATVNNITWSVNNTSIATINSAGLLTAVSDGIVTVYATAIDGSATTGSVQVTITNNNEVESVSLSSSTGNTNIDIKEDTLRIIATALPLDAYNRNVTWSVNDTSIATVNTEGLVTAKANGTVKVIATSVNVPGISDTISIEITNQTTNITNLLTEKDIFEVYPNPSSGNFTIKGMYEIKYVYIFNITGKNVKTFHVNNNGFTVINIAELPKGFYFVKIETVNGNYRKKIILE